MILDTVNTIVQSTRPKLVGSHGVSIDDVAMGKKFGTWSATHDSETSFSSATLQVETPFSLTPGRHTVKIYAGWAGKSDLVFYGEFTARSSAYYKRKQSITCGGFLSRTQEGLDLSYAYATTDDAWTEAQGLIDYTPVDLRNDPTDAAIIVHILERYGITPGSTNHRIEASEWQPAKLSPIKWDAGTPGWSVIQRIDKISPNYRTSDGRDGAIHRRQLYGSVPGTVRHTFHQGIDILDISVSEEYQVWNKVVVRGAHFGEAVYDENGDLVEQVIATVPGTGYTPSPFIPSPPGVRTDESIDDDWIETVPDAARIGASLLGRLSQPLKDHTLTTWACPDIEVGDALKVVAAAVDVNSSTFVVAHTLSSGPLRSVMTLRGSTFADTRTNQQPETSVIVSTFLETVIVDSVATPLVLITVDARLSRDPDGTIASWTIHIADAVFTGTDIALAIVTYPYLGDPPVTISVDVVDNGGLASRPYAQSVTWNRATALVEPLAVAEATRASATRDGEATWGTAAIAATAVAPIALGDATLYGTSGGKLYRSLDFLATAPTEIIVAGGASPLFAAAVTCLWCNEKLTSRWVVGLANGQIHLSIDAGLTWTKIATFPGAINDISEAPGAANSITVASGTGLYHTFGPANPLGTDNWQLLTNHTATCLRFAAAGYDGISRVYAGYADGRVIRWKDTPTPTIDILFQVPAGECSLNGITAAIDHEELFIFTDFDLDPGFASYRWTPAGGVVAGPSTGTAANRAIRSAAGDFCYVACDGSLMKILRDHAYDIRVMTSPQRCLAVGYAAQGHPPTPPPTGAIELVLIGSSGSVGATAVKVFHFIPGAGWADKSTGLPTSYAFTMHQTWLAANPFNPDEWLLMLSADKDGKTGSVWAETYVTVGGITLPFGDMRLPYVYREPPLDHVGEPLDPVPFLWYTANAGETWTSVSVNQAAPIAGLSTGTPPEPYEIPYRYWFPTRVEWSRTVDGDWAIAGSLVSSGRPPGISGIVDNHIGRFEFGYVTGTRSQLTISETDVDMAQLVVESAFESYFAAKDPPQHHYTLLGCQIMPGPDGEWVFTVPNQAAFGQSEILSGALGRTLLSSSGLAQLTLETAPGLSRALVGVISGIAGRPLLQGQGFATADYNSHFLDLAGLDALGLSIARTADGVYVGTRTGALLFFPGETFAGGAAGVVVDATTVAGLHGLATGFVRSDRQTQVFIAARRNRLFNEGTWVSIDGTTWELQADPTAVGFHPNPGFVEVLNRAGAPPPGAPRLLVTPTTASVEHGTTQQFTATPIDLGPGVTWSVTEGGGGTITTGGLYTAPTTPGTYHVVATSTADPTVTGSATITVPAPPAITALRVVSLAAGGATLIRPGTSVQMQAVDDNHPTVIVAAVTWSVDSGAATISGGGLLSLAGGADPESQSVVRATLIADTSVFATLTMHHGTGHVPILTSPDSTVDDGSFVTITADELVFWDVPGGEYVGLDPDDLSIHAYCNGYSDGATFTVTATNQADVTQVATIDFTVIA